MQGGIAQTLGLVLAANAKLHGLDHARWPDASIYAFCNSVRFVGSERGGLFSAFRQSLFEDPEQWLAHIGLGARLRVVTRNDPAITDRESVGFAGGGPVFLIEPDASRSAWRGDWRVSNQSARDQRIWSVVYNEVSRSPSDQQPALSAQVMRTRLVEALEDAITFSTKHTMGFEAHLAKSLKAIDASEPLDDFYHADMIPTGLMDLEHAQLFGCAAGSWVFGGMGSWNDVWFEGSEQTTYERVSDQLFKAIIDGLVTATNSTR